MQQALKYRAWQIADAYERIDNAKKHGLDDDKIDDYYYAIIDFIFSAHEDIARLS